MVLDDDTGVTAGMQVISTFKVLIEWSELILKTLRGVVSDWFLEDIEEAT